MGIRIDAGRSAAYEQGGVMKSGAGVWKSSDESLWLLIAASVAFLFVGFFKGLVWSPIDLTVLAAALTCLGLLLSRGWLGDAIGSPITWLLTALAGVLIIRLFPEYTAWGVRKAAEMVSLGVPAYLAGLAIARQPQGVTNLASVFAYMAVPLACYLVIYSATHNPYSFSEVGSAGYQLTGAFLGLALVSAAYLANPWCFAAAALGVAISGHLSGALFAGVSVLIMWSFQRDWKQTGAQLALLISACAVYWLIVAPPLVIMRVLWKLGAIVLTVTQDSGSPTLAPEQSAGALTSRGGILGSMVAHSLSGMPTESQSYLVDIEAADRSEYFGDAVRLIGEYWLFGRGYGVPTYAGEAYPHNVLLETFAEGGIVAAALTATVLVGSLLYAARSFNLLVFGFVLTMCLTGMVSGYWGSRLLMFAIGLAVGAAATARSQLQEQLGQKQRR